MSSTGLVPGITGACIIKFSVMPSGIKFRFSHELLHQFSSIYFKKLRKMSWIQIFMLEYVVTTSTGTYGS